METLIKIQSELKAPKNQFNKFGNYKYRSCEDILEAVKPLCIKHKALLTLSDFVLDIGGTHYVQASAKFKHEDFETEVTAWAEHPKNQKGMSPSQMTGAASSYARKYALNGLFCIDDNKDPDNNTGNQQNDKPEDIKPKPMTDQQFKNTVEALKKGKTIKWAKDLAAKKGILIDEDTEFKLITAAEG